jgi:hypothetical protein
VGPISAFGVLDDERIKSNTQTLSEAYSPPPRLIIIPRSLHYATAIIKAFTNVGSVLLYQSSPESSYEHEHGQSDSRKAHPEPTAIQPKARPKRVRKVVLIEHRARYSMSTWTRTRISGERKLHPDPFQFVSRSGRKTTFQGE